MSMMRFDPFRDFAVMQSRVNRLLGDAQPRGTWVPAVDIYEVEGSLVLKAELPDMQREQISVTVENQVLTIRGERKPDQEIKQDQFHRIERAYGSFIRTFTLPTTVDAGRIGAEYKNGVLTVKLPLREDSKPRTINVDVAA